MTLSDKKHQYAQVLVKIGVDLKLGQILCVEAPTERTEFVKILAHEAYKAGFG